MTHQTTFPFHTDPGHGWVEVPGTLIDELGIRGKISRCSYKHAGGGSVFLEEDCDAGHFIEAFNARYGHSPRFRNVNVEEDSFIRGLDRYHAPCECEDYRLRGACAC